MLFNVPQFIHTEDKIVGPLTAKQLGWLAVGAVIALVCWYFLDTSAFYLSAVIIFSVFGALAFYRPYNQSLINFIFSGISYVLNPKLYIWNREGEVIVKNNTPKINSGVKPIAVKKSVNLRKIEEVTGMLNKLLK